jgi:hypothetical protein
MREIEQWAGDQIECRQAGGRRDLADDQIVGGEIQGGDDNPEGDGLGDRLSDGEFGKDALRRASLRLLPARGIRRVSELNGLSRQRFYAPAQAGQPTLRQIPWRQHRDPADQDAGDQGRLKQGGARQHR